MQLIIFITFELVAEIEKNEQDFYSIISKEIKEKFNLKNINESNT